MNMGPLKDVLWDPLATIINMWICLYFYLLGVQGWNGVGGGLFVWFLVMPIDLVSMFEVL